MSKPDNPGNGQGKPENPGHGKPDNPGHGHGNGRPDKPSKPPTRTVG